MKYIGDQSLYIYSCWNNSSIHDFLILNLFFFPHTWGTLTLCKFHLKNKTKKRRKKVA